MRHLRNNQGQVVLEYILITFVLISFSFLVKAMLTSSGAIPNLLKQPWAMVAGMIESGVWAEPSKAKAQHPAHYKRHLSFKGDNE